MKIYADENFPLRTVKELQKFGHDVLTAFDDGRANQAIADEEVLARAAALGRAVLTLNRLDFKRLHYSNPNRAGVIICTEHGDRIGQARRISEKIIEIGDLQNRLIKIYRPN